MSFGGKSVGGMSQLKVKETARLKKQWCFLLLYYKTVRIRNLREIDKFRSKLTPSGLDKHASLDKHTSLNKQTY
jgi:hypothetical protein